MATKSSVCAICDLRHVTSRSVNWCPECEEALCTNCSEHHSLSRGTRSHKTIPISQYQSLPTFVTDIQQFCLYHNEKYQQYCMKHEFPICYKCIKEHGKCSEVIPLEDVIGEIKSSEIFRDLEQSLKDVLKNIKQIREDRENNVKLIQTQKKTITMEIDNIKTQINQHIDKLKDAVIKELGQVYDDCNGRIQSSISSLKDQEYEIGKCSTEFENITKYASDLQTFLGMREIQSKVTDNESRLKSMISNKSLENVDIQLIINDKVQDFLISEKFGTITIKESPSSCINIASKKIRQAQISSPNTVQPIRNISVDLKQKFDTSCEWPSGCSMTQTRSLGGYLFTDGSANDLKRILLNAKGETEDISFPLGLHREAFDVECFNKNKAAVTTGNQFGIKEGGYEVDIGICIVDLTKRKVIHFIELPSNPYGITCNGTLLICCVQYKDIHVISCKDYSISTIPNTLTTESSYVSTHDDKIFYTKPEENKVFCCFFDGTPAWAFQDKTNLEYPLGITVDKHGNVFVVGLNSSNVLVLSSDGKHCKQILTKEHSLNLPYAIFSDKIKNQLLVTDDSFANLYNISYS